MLEKSSKMSVRETMIDLAGAPPSYGEQPRWLTKFAKDVGMSYRTARSLWNDEIKRPNHWAIKKVRREAEKAEARRKLAALADQYTAIAGGMRAQDEEFYRPQIDRLEHLVRIISGLDRPDDHKD